MPTPSSDPPRDPSSPPPYTYSAAATTCPDDLQLPSRQSHDVAPDSMEVQQGQAGDSESPNVYSLPSADDGPAADGVVTVEGPRSTGPSSRATTLSPRSYSGANSLTSPVTSGPDSDSSKAQDPCMDYPPGRDDPACLVRVSNEHSASLYHDADSIDLDILEDDSYCPYAGPEFTSLRSIATSPSSFLRAGSRFHGTQQSERQVYDVQVEIKHVDMRESFLCGYLRIQGLTEDHPTLTTYFEGEIIGSKYSFFTQHDDWGANMKVDLSHWAKFSAFRPFQKYARKGAVPIQDIAQKENIFMRWKEHFLVPDHRVRTITGASFEGFYYICFNQVKGEVSGIYFHSKSEKFQQLELKHVPDRGCFSAMEFR